jgi:dihydropteroate synthase
MNAISTSRLLRCGTGTLDLTQPAVMGVLNVTPDSFSDGGRFADAIAAVDHGLAMIAAGAAVIDVGGESTRPSAADVSEEEERRRVVPVIAALARQTQAILSVDTSKPGVMLAAVDAGATLINDVRALRAPGAIEAARRSSAAVCLMHMQGEPRTMQTDPRYVDVVEEVRAFLAERAGACLEAGISSDGILLDPGIGFGKRVEHNLALLASLAGLVELGYPVLIGVSRKSMFQTLLGRRVEQRLPGALAVATAAVLAGVSIVRTHDVPETVDAVRIAAALRAAAPGRGGTA